MKAPLSSFFLKKFTCVNNNGTFMIYIQYSDVSNRHVQKQMRCACMKSCSRCLNSIISIDLRGH